MGISKLVGSAATLLLLASVYLKHSGMTWIPWFLLIDSLLAYLVTITSHPAVNVPLLFGKKSEGGFPLWSMIVFGQYIVFVQMYVLLKRLMRRREPVYTEVSEGLYVGGWPCSLNHVPPGMPSVIDCTCELPRTSVVVQNAYYCIATWDTRAPRPSQIELAVRWACKERAKKKPIYVHCAFGHGRSVSVMCALLVALGVAADWKDAEKIIKSRRPLIKLNALHRKSLEEWSKHRSYQTEKT